MNIKSYIVASLSLQWYHPSSLEILSSKATSYQTQPIYGVPNNFEHRYCFEAEFAFISRDLANLTWGYIVHYSSGIIGDKRFTQALHIVLS